MGARYYHTPVDMWSLGCIMAELISGRPLFMGDSEVPSSNLRMLCHSFAHSAVPFAVTADCDHRPRDAASGKVCPESSWRASLEQSQTLDSLPILHEQIKNCMTPFLRRSLLQIGQLFKIFQILGTPSESTWKGVEGMPCWQPQFPQWHAQDLAEVCTSAVLSTAVVSR